MATRNLILYWQHQPLHCQFVLSVCIKGTGVTVYSLHPGVVETELTRNFNDGCFSANCFKCFYRWCCCCKGGVLTADEGAATSLYCALEPAIATHSGRYYRYF